MKERIRQTLEEQYFPPIFKKIGRIPFFKKTSRIPLAPPEAITEYERLKSKWLTSFPEIPGINPSVSVRPIEINGTTTYVVAKEIIYERSFYQ